MPRLPDTRLAAALDALEERYDRQRLVREIGKAVRKIRRETGKLQSDLAKSIRTSQATISRIERDATVFPRWDALECIVDNFRYRLTLSRGVRVEKKQAKRSGG